MSALINTWTSEPSCESCPMVTEIPYGQPEVHAVLSLPNSMAATPVWVSVHTSMVAQYFASL